MIIRRLTIKNFGKIHEKDMELSPGINVLYGENESGKTTVHTFIKSMLYGITRQRGRAAKNDPYTSYEPWENPTVYGGTLWFENSGKKFRLTRNFHKTSPYAELFCEDTGEILDVERGKLDTVLGNVSEIVYENTVSVGQLKSVTGQDLVRELKNYMASYQGAGDSSVDLGRTMQMLKMWRKGYQVQQDRRKKETQKEQEKIAAQMEYLRSEMDDLMEQEAQVGEREESLHMGPGQENGEALLDGRIAAAKKKMTGLIIAVIGAALLAVGGILAFGALLPGKIVPQILTAVAGFLMVAGGVLGILRLNRECTKRVKIKERWLQQQEKLKWNRESLMEAYEEKETALSNIQTEYREYEAESWLPTSEDLEIQALNMAMETIEGLSGNIHNQVGGRLRERTSRILGEITGGKYQEVLMDKDMNMTVNAKDRIVQLERLSRGTMEQIYFALRMAAGELLCGREKFPVILDDVFGMYDEDRLAAVLHWLEKEDRQVIISTCHKREMEILEKEGIPFTKLEL